MAGPRPGAVETGRAVNAKVFRNPEPNSYSAVVSPGAIHYRTTPGGPWLDKRPRFVAGAANEWVSSESDVAMRTFQTGAGAQRRWWVQFVETLSGKGIRFQLAFQPTPVTGTNELRFTDSQARTWSYFHTKTGGKMLGPSIAAKEGAKSFSFPYELIGGADPLALDPTDGSVRSGSVFFMPRPHLNGADRVAYPASEWTLVPNADPATGGTLSFSYDDTGLPSGALPYRVDPSTNFAVAVSEDDQRVWRIHTVYPPTSGTLQRATNDLEIAIHRSFVTPDYHVYVALLRFSTLFLGANATPSASSLDLRINDRGAANALSLVAGWQSWDGSSSTDWASTPIATAHAGTALTSLTIGAVNTLALINLTSIALSGTSYLKLYVSQRAADAAPTGQNYAVFAAFDDPLSQEPRLNVDFSLAMTGRVPPDALLAATGFSGALSDVLADDANWLVGV